MGLHRSFILVDHILIDLDQHVYLYAAVTMQNIYDDDVDDDDDDDDDDDLHCKSYMYLILVIPPMKLE